MTRTRKAIAKSLIVAAAALGLAGTTSSDARACGGAWVPIMEQQIDWRVPGVARAEKQMDQGKSVDAAASVVRMMPHIKSLKMSEGKPLVNRAMRVLALSVARNDGRLDAAKQLPVSVQDTWVGKTAEDRKVNLAWAVDVLRKTSSAKKDDPQAQTELAEALARVDAHQQEAFDILNKLANKDLVASPEGYATLAQLKSERGDKAGTKLALQRCEAMAKDKALCSSTARG